MIVGVGRLGVVLGLVRDPMRLSADRLRALERYGGRDQAQDHAGDRGVDPRSIGEVPQCESERDVDDLSAHVVPGSDHDDDHDEDRPRERTPLDAARVEDGDHQDRADVVGDRERQEERLQGRRGVLRREREDPNAKAMSVAIGMPQPRPVAPPPATAT